MPAAAARSRSRAAGPASPPACGRRSRAGAGAGAGAGGRRGGGVCRVGNDLDRDGAVTYSDAPLPEPERDM